MLADVLDNGIHNQEQNAQRQEAARRGDDNRHGLVGLGHHLHAKPLAAADDLTHGRKQGQRARKAQAHPQSIKCRRKHRVFESKGFRAGKDDAVDHDQRDIDAQRIGHGRQKCLDN